jgi:hypothetical protein
MTGHEIDWVRTIPWHADEYIVVGQRLVYDTSRFGVITRVRMLGCTSATIDALREAGHVVVYPAKARRP